jgi:hypothetical protein
MPRNEEVSQHYVNRIDACPCLRHVLSAALREPIRLQPLSSLGPTSSIVRHTCLFVRGPSSGAPSILSVVRHPSDVVRCPLSVVRCQEPPRFWPICFARNAFDIVRGPLSGTPSADDPREAINGRQTTRKKPVIQTYTRGVSGGTDVKGWQDNRPARRTICQARRVPRRDRAGPVLPTSDRSVASVPFPLSPAWLSLTCEPHRSQLRPGRCRASPRRPAPVQRTRPWHRGPRYW